MSKSNGTNRSIQPHNTFRERLIKTSTEAYEKQLSNLCPDVSDKERKELRNAFKSEKDMLKYVNKLNEQMDINYTKIKEVLQRKGEDPRGGYNFSTVLELGKVIKDTLRTDCKIAAISDEVYPVEIKATLNKAKKEKMYRVLEQQVKWPKQDKIYGIYACDVVYALKKALKNGEINSSERGKFQQLYKDLNIYKTYGLFGARYPGKQLVMLYGE